MPRGSPLPVVFLGEERVRGLSARERESEIGEEAKTSRFELDASSSCCCCSCICFLFFLSCSWACRAMQEQGERVLKRAKAKTDRLRKSKKKRERKHENSIDGASLLRFLSSFFTLRKASRPSTLTTRQYPVKFGLLREALPLLEAAGCGSAVEGIAEEKKENETKEERKSVFFFF